MEKASSKQKMQMVHLLIDAEMLDLIDEHQHRMMIKNRATAIRFMLALGLRGLRAGVKAKREGK